MFTLNPDRTPPHNLKLPWPIWPNINEIWFILTIHESRILSSLSYMVFYKKKSLNLVSWAKPDGYFELRVVIRVRCWGFGKQFRTSSCVELTEGPLLNGLYAIQNMQSVWFCIAYNPNTHLLPSRRNLCDGFLAGNPPPTTEICWVKFLGRTQNETQRQWRILLRIFVYCK